jgi:hypothetical protein
MNAVVEATQTLERNVAGIRGNLSAFGAESGGISMSWNILTWRRLPFSTPPLSIPPSIRINE